MSDTIRIIRLTDRAAPDGSWASGDPATVSVDEARELIATKRAALAQGETLPPLAEALTPVRETAALDQGDTPERAAPPPASRRRGSS